MAGETVERSRTIQAPVARVWAVVGDVTRMPEWSEELESVDLLDGDGRAVGSRFRGNNRDGGRRWSMTCVVDAYEPERTLEFHTEDAKGETRTRWWYRLEPADVGGGESDSTVVTEGFLRVAKFGVVRALAEKKLLGDRTEHNARNIDASLTRLAEAVERG